jgi:hypothetical protein
MAKKDRQLRGAAFMDALDARIQTLTPEDMLDSSKEDAEIQEDFKIADELHRKALERGDKDAIEKERLSKQAQREVAQTKPKTRKTGKR